MVIGAHGMYLKTFDLKHGMPNSTVKCFQQDKRGFLWMATFGGLCRFDGEHFDVFRHDDEDSLSLGKNHLEVLLVDDECLWIGGEDVMDRLDFKTRLFQHYRPHGKEYLGRIRRMVKVQNVLYVHTTTNILYCIPDIKGEPFDWLYVDYPLLSTVAASCGLKAELVAEGDHYDYLARFQVSESRAK